MIAIVLLVMLAVALFVTTKQPENLRIVNEKYKTLREHLKETGNEKFRVLTRHIPLTGKRWMRNILLFLACSSL